MGKPDVRSEGPSEDASYRMFHADSIEALSPDAKYQESQTWVAGMVTRAGSGLENVTLEEFVESVMERIGRAIPTPEEIRENVSLSYSTAALVNPSVVEAELAHRDEIHRMREMAYEAEREQREKQAQERRLAHEQEEAQKRQIWAQARMTEMEVEHKRKMQEDMRAIERDHYRQQLAQMASPVLAIFNSLRAQMYEGAQAVLEALKSGKANGPAARKARGMIQACRLLNGLEDDDLEQLISQADTLVLRPG